VRSPRWRKFGSPLELACLHTVTTLTGSAILALAFAHGRLDADETVWKLAHLDEDWTDRALGHGRGGVPPPRAAPAGIRGRLPRHSAT
jgi:chaperone required for assembly of F1-ATPase